MLQYDRISIPILLTLTLDLLWPRTSTQAVAEQRRVEQELSEEVDGANIRIAEINDDLAQIMQELGEAKVSRLHRLKTLHIQSESSLHVFGGNFQALVS